MQGEVWRARRTDGGVSLLGPEFVLKRMFHAASDPAARRAGMREVQFGRRLRWKPGCTHFVEHFWATPGSPGALPELWLVFADAGDSLANLIYETAADGVRVRSPTWKQLHGHERGPAVVKSLFGQLLRALATAHADGILHRDIKPSNILVRPHPQRAGELVLRLADWSSAVDLSNKTIGYGASGPSADEETLEYSAPEVRASGGTLPYLPNNPELFDAWSAGATILELLLGARPSEWLILSPNRASKLRRSMAAADPAEVLVAELLTALREWCLWGGDIRHAVQRGTPKTSSTCPGFIGFKLAVQNWVGQNGLRELGSLLAPLGQHNSQVLFRMLLADAGLRISPAEAIKEGIENGPDGSEE